MGAKWLLWDLLVCWDIKVISPKSLASDPTQSPPTQYLPFPTVLSTFGINFIIFLRIWVVGEEGSGRFMTFAAKEGLTDLSTPRIFSRMSSTHIWLLKAGMEIICLLNDIVWSPGCGTTSPKPNMWQFFGAKLALCWLGIGRLWLVIQCGRKVFNTVLSRNTQILHFLSRNVSF